MGRSKPRKIDNLTKLIVVEVSTPCLCHTVVTARWQDRLSYTLLYVCKPLVVEFGDILLVDFGHDGKNNTDEIRSAYLYRGDCLFFRLILDPFPEGLLQQIIRERMEAVGGDPQVDFLL
jgi:hypothetical protein